MAEFGIGHSGLIRYSHFGHSDFRECGMTTSLVPIPPCDVNVRAATMDDVAFIDALQKLHTRMVGWMPTKQLEGKIAAGHVLVAEEGPSTSSGRSAAPIGYCIGHDQYFKRDDVGIIYQMNVA